MKQISALLKQLGSWYFWMSAAVCMALAGWLGSKLTELKFVDNYQALTPSLKQLFSVQDWWLETLVGACIPMFALFALQFYTYRLFKNSALKAHVISALPFLPKIAWLAGKPIMFMLATGAFYVSLAFRLEGPTFIVVGLAGIAIIVIGFIVRYHYSSLLAGRGFSQRTDDWAVRLGNISLTLAIACWLFADAWAPLKYLLWLKRYLG